MAQTGHQERVMSHTQHMRPNLEQHYSKGVTNNYNKALLAAIMVMMVTLLLITIVSLALSVAAYNQSKPEQTTVQNQQSESEPENDTIVAQTQLDTTCNNLSQVLFQVLDTNINDLASLIVLQNTDMEPQETSVDQDCGIKWPFST